MLASIVAGKRFSPAHIPGLRAWYDSSVASSVTLNATTVSQWDDLSGNGFHLTQTTAANQPTWVTNAINSRPAIQWPNVGGSNNIRLINTSFSMTRPYTIFAVVKTTLKTNQGAYQATICDSYNNVGAVMGFNASPAASATPTIGFGTDVRSTATFAHPETLILTGTAQSGGSSGSIRKNNGTATTGTVNTNTFSGLSIGQLRGNPSPINTAFAFSGQMAELIFYGTTAVTADGETAIRRYLGAKWGITL